LIGQCEHVKHIKRNEHVKKRVQKSDGERVEKRAKSHQRVEAEPIFS